MSNWILLVYQLERYQMFTTINKLHIYIITRYKLKLDPLQK